MEGAAAYGGVLRVPGPDRGSSLPLLFGRARATRQARGHSARKGMGRGEPRVVRLRVGEAASRGARRAENTGVRRVRERCELRRGSVVRERRGEQEGRWRVAAVKRRRMQRGAPAGTRGHGGVELSARRAARGGERRRREKEERKGGRKKKREKEKKKKEKGKIKIEREKDRELSAGFAAAVDARARRLQSEATRTRNEKKGNTRTGIEFGCRNGESSEKDFGESGARTGKNLE